jgi:putative transposase
VKVARTVRRGEVRKGLSYETTRNDLGKSEEQRYLAGPLPYKTVRIYRLSHLPPTLSHRLKEAQMEAARVWNLCMQTHKHARIAHARWPWQSDLEQATKGKFALNAQAVQQIVHAFLANIETTRTLRSQHPEMRMKYPWRTKRFYPVKWPAQAVHREKGRVILPMGRGNPSIVLPLVLPDNAGACALVWNRGFELHVCLEIVPAEEAPGSVQATVDLGEIHKGRLDNQHGCCPDRDRARHPFPQAAAQ